jgi:hypothetical protein
MVCPLENLGDIYKKQTYHWLKKYPNHTEHLILNSSEQLWVRDIKYIRN